MIRDHTGRVCNYVAVLTDLSKLRSSQLELDFLAHHDPLTRLPNRLLLLSPVEHGIELAQRDGTHLALLMLDLDRFKDINDSFGHLVGDELLQLVATRLVKPVRTIDTVGRFGGDEFSVLMEDVAGAEQAARVANDIIRVLSEPYGLSSGVEVRIGASVGISIYPDNGLTPQCALQRRWTSHQGSLKTRMMLIGHPRGLFGPGHVFHQHGKFVAAKAANRVDGAHLLDQPGGHELQ